MVPQVLARDVRSWSGSRQIPHVGAKTESGFLIVNRWPSGEASEATGRDPRRLGVLERAEISPHQIRREHYEVEHFVIFD
jgi:hypothetical protein